MSGFKPVEEGIPYGVYIWQVNGKPVVNENFDYLQIASRRGDGRKIAALKEFVSKELGIDDGAAAFIEGARPVTEYEYEEQKARQAAGYVPDQYDLGNLIDEDKYAREFDK